MAAQTSSLPFRGNGKPRTELPTLPFPQFLQLLAQSTEPPNQASEIDAMDHPRGNIGGEEKLDGVHCGLRLSGRLALAATPSPTRDSIACASSISRCSSSSRNRDQQTRNAKQRNPIQLISSTCSMRGSIDPPPPMTGCGMFVAKNQNEKINQRHIQRPEH